ncbi:MAG: LysR family transcriptional regulator [Burkholderiales bacterium]|nr:LysR family transcriptional regulator [Burkholderiales bacterium]
MQEPSVRQLRHFVLVAECGSFRAASERAFRSQSALTLSIQELESVLGASLFQAGRRAQLTDYGRECLPIARDIVERFAQQTVRLRNVSAMATVTMAVLPSFAARWLPGFLALFTERHPRIALRVLDDNSRNVEDMVINGRADVGIVSMGAIDRRIEAKALLKDAFALVCDRNHPLASEPHLPWSALKGQKLLGNLTHQLLAGTVAAHHVHEPQLFVSNMTSLLSLIAAGDWTSPLPALAVPLHAPEIVAVPLRRPSITRQIGIIRLKSRPVEPAVAAVISIVEEVVKGGGQGRAAGSSAGLHTTDSGKKSA